MAPVPRAHARTSPRIHRPHWGLDWLLTKYGEMAKNPQGGAVQSLELPYWKPTALVRAQYHLRKKGGGGSSTVLWTSKAVPGRPGITNQKWVY